MALQTLRNAHLIARFVLVWFALSVGVAVASPFVKPQGMELLCSGSGAVKLLVQSDEGGEVIALHTLDCSLCATGYAPPSRVQCAVESGPTRTHGLERMPAFHFAAPSAAPLLARGPPASI